MTAKIPQAGATRQTRKGRRPPIGSTMSFKTLRKTYGLSRRAMARALSASDAALAKWENGTATPDAAGLTKIKELEEILMGLARVMKKDFIGTWMNSPNEACGGNAPIDLLAKGDYDSVEDLVYFLEAGEPV